MNASPPNLFGSGWSPTGILKSWKRVQMTTHEAGMLMGDRVRGTIIDACAWRDRSGTIRVIVVDTDAGVRAIYRRSVEGHARVELGGCL